MNLIQGQPHEPALKRVLENLKHYIDIVHHQGYTRDALAGGCLPLISNPWLNMNYFYSNWPRNVYGRKKCGRAQRRPV